MTQEDTIERDEVALYGRTPKVRAHRETASKKKKEKTKRQQLLDLI